MDSFHPALKYLVVLVTTFGVSHLFFSALERAERLPDWLNPLRAALLVTFLVQVWLFLSSHQPSPEPLP